MPPLCCSRSRVLRVVLLVIAGLVTAAACGSDGRVMRAPAPGATAPPRATSTTTTTRASATFTLTAPEWQPGAPLPADHQCPSTVSPALIWTQPPAGTVELALAVIDLSAGARIHWLVVGIPPTAPGISKGSVPPGAVELRNSAGTIGWDPPCPASDVHAYSFQLMAFDAPQAIDASTDPDAARDALATAATATAVLTATVDPTATP